MKRILVSLGTVVFLGALVASGTGAFFSDEETSTGNTFTAGALDLQVDSAAHYNGLICFDGIEATAGTEWIPEATVVWDAVDMRYELTGADVAAAVAAYNLANPAANPEAGDECGGTWSMTDLGPSNVFFDFDDIKPGDTGENTVSLHVLNNDAFVCAAIHNIEDNDNSLTEPEAEDGDTTGGDGEGELAEELNFMVWEDDGDNVFEDGEDELTTGPASELGTGVVYDLYTPATGPLTGASTTYLGVQWCFGTFTSGVCSGTSTTNVTQTDSFTADVTFYAEQARNNGDFTCPDIDEFEGDDEEPVPTIAWVESGQTGGDASIVEDEDAPTGDDVLELTTINDVNSRVRYSYDVADINLSSFTGFSYDSKQVSAADMVNGNASFRLVVDLDGDPLTVGDIKDVTYEPYYNIAAHNTLNDASIVPATWQNWAATMADGKFWAGGVTTVLGPSEGAGGAYATNFTIAQLLAAYPSAKITGISIGMGTYNVNQVIQVDNLIYNGNVLGFE